MRPAALRHPSAVDFWGAAWRWKTHSLCIGGRGPESRKAGVSNYKLDNCSSLSLTADIQPVAGSQALLSHSSQMASLSCTPSPCSPCLLWAQLSPPANQMMPVKVLCKCKELQNRMWALALAPSNTICHVFTTEKMTQRHRLRPGFFSWELRPATLWLNPLFLFSLLSVSQPLSFLPPVFPVCPSFPPSLLPGHFLTVHWTSHPFSYLPLDFLVLLPRTECPLPSSPVIES